MLGDPVDIHSIDNVTAMDTKEVFTKLFFALTNGQKNHILFVMEHQSGKVPFSFDIQEVAFINFDVVSVHFYKKLASSDGIDAVCPTSAFNLDLTF